MNCFPFNEPVVAKNATTAIAFKKLSEKSGVFGAFINIGGRNGKKA